MSYRIVRVNDDKHNTFSKAVKDMAAIIDYGFYWKRSQPIPMATGTTLVGMGSHRGRGLFIVGITKDNKWIAEGDGRYHHKIKVAWSHIVYQIPAIQLAVIENIPGFNVYKGCSLTQQQFRGVMDMVLAGEAIDPWAYGQAAA